jgi:hypothetical protein
MFVCADLLWVLQVLCWGYYTLHAYTFTTIAALHYFLLFNILSCSLSSRQEREASTHLLGALL